jgi:hypothetical protein
MRTHAPVESTENYLWRLPDSTVINTREECWVSHIKCEGISCLYGRLWLDKQASLAVLSSYKVRDCSRFKSLRDARRAIKKFPRWQTTRWVCKLVDFGEIGWVLDCLTGTQVELGSPEFNAVIAKVNDMFKGGEK